VENFVNILEQVEERISDIEVKVEELLRSESNREINLHDHSFPDLCGVIKRWSLRILGVEEGAEIQIKVQKPCSVKL
jgi:hypothetical protein